MDVTTPIPHSEHDNKGFSEEKCVRCGWVMGSPALNCQNDDTPHRFPSQESLEEQLEAAQAENRMLRMWLCTDGARARGLAESMTELPIAVSLEGIEENSRLIVELLNIEQRLGLPSASSPASTPDARKGGEDA